MNGSAVYGRSWYGMLWLIWFLIFGLKFVKQEGRKEAWPKELIHELERGFQGEGVGVKSQILSIYDVTQLPNNGCRIPKKVVFNSMERFGIYSWNYHIKSLKAKAIVGTACTNAYGLISIQNKKLQITILIAHA